MAAANSTQHPKQEQEPLQALWLKECDDSEKLQSMPCDTFCNAVKFCFKLRKWNPLRFCENTGFKESFYTRIKENLYDEKYQPTLSSVMAICVALHLPSQFSFKLVKLSGNALRASKLHNCYRFILNHYELFQNVDEVNVFLIAKGFKPICDKDIYENKNFTS